MFIKFAMRIVIKGLFLLYIMLNYVLVSRYYKISMVPQSILLIMVVVKALNASWHPDAIRGIFDIQIKNTPSNKGLHYKTLWIRNRTIP
jgi:hypothetical protein